MRRDDSFIIVLLTLFCLLLGIIILFETGVVGSKTLEITVLDKHSEIVGGGFSSTTAYYVITDSRVMTIHADDREETVFMYKQMETGKTYSVRIKFDYTIIELYGEVK